MSLERKCKVILNLTSPMKIFFPQGFPSIQIPVFDHSSEECHFPACGQKAMGKSVMFNIGSSQPKMLWSLNIQQFLFTLLDLCWKALFKIKESMVVHFSHYYYYFAFGEKLFIKFAKI